MAQRLPVNLTDKSSLNPVVSGLALTNELANVAFPESSSKRFTFNLTNVLGVPSVGAAPVELTIDGVPNFRFRPADTSTVFCDLTVVYTSSVSSSSHQLRFTILNRAGVVSLVSDSTNTKMPTASPALVSLNIVAGQLQVTIAGVAGDIAGRSKARLTITEITDLG